jgi:hypothetical protein
MYTYFCIFNTSKMLLEMFNSLCSFGTADFIMRKNASSAEIEVYIIFYSSITIDDRDSNKNSLFLMILTTIHIITSFYFRQFL